MTPFRFGPTGRQLYGVLHAAGHSRRSDAALLICNAFGQEAVRFHRMQRVLADRLSTRGLAVLRFDYFGTGESDGFDEDTSLPGWCDDLLLAHRELCRRSRANRIFWLGVRLGGTAAMLSSVRADPRPERLVLWDPIIDGHEYLRQLAAAQEDMRASHVGQRASVAPAPIAGEALGFGFGAALREQLAGLDATKLSTVCAARATLVCNSRQPELPAIASRWDASGTPCRVIASDQVFDWFSEEAMNTSLVPTRIVDVLADTMELEAHA